MLLALTMLVLEGHITFPGPSESPVHSELLGTYQVTTWVPVFVLYNPPGNESSSFVDLGGSNITVQFQGHTSEFDVIGEYSANMGFGFGFGPGGGGATIRVGIFLMNQTWEVDRYSSMGREWTQANLRNCTVVAGYEVIKRSECSDYGIWLKDMTNTASNYSMDFNVGAGANKSISLDCLLDAPEPINAGYNITLMGVDVGMSVLISSQGSPIPISCMFGDATMPLSIHLFSTTPIQQDPYSTEGALLWFG